MIEQVVTRNKRPLVALPRVGKPDGVLCCWVCRQAWPTRYDLVVDAVSSTVRLDDSQPLALSRNELHVLQALIAAFPRWLSRNQLAEHTWDYRPEGDMPDPSVVMGVAKKLNDYFKGSRYVIERNQKRGIRLVDVDTILRDRDIDERFAAKVVDKLARESLATISARQTDKALAEKPLPEHRLTGKRVGTKRDQRLAERERNATKPSNRKHRKSRKRKSN